MSAQQGDRVALYVSTSAPSYQVQAYRLGYYGGLGARLVWQSPEHTGTEQPAPILTPVTNMVVAPWSPSLRITIGARWTQGQYLLKLVASNGGASYVPLVVRDDASDAAVLVVAPVTTWQAYNMWGGYDLYKGPSGTATDRSRIVSFDRPYLLNRGASDLDAKNEIPMVTLAEQQGLDVTYTTDVDVHEQPQLLLQHRVVLFLGHDEYWSSSMRSGVEAARDQGVNVAIFGGNTGYRHIRFDASPVGPDREVICYKVASEDPLYGVDDDEVTTQWRLPPVPRPESELNGGFFDATCFPAKADLVVTAPRSWLYRGTGLSEGSTISGMIGGEFDGVDPTVPTPDSIQILAHSPVACPSGTHQADVTYYTTSSGAGVLDVGSTKWIAWMNCATVFTGGTCDPRVVRIAENVWMVFGRGPAGLSHPSWPNLARFGITLQYPIHV